MIQTIQMGEQNNDVLHLKFGTGDITMNHIEMDPEKFSLGFGVLPGRKVGETYCEPYESDSYLKAWVAMAWRQIVHGRGWIIKNF